MSEYRLYGDTPDGPVVVQIGWEPTWEYFFMFIGLERDPPLYDNQEQVEHEMLTLEYYQRVLERFGIRNISLKPGDSSGLYEKLVIDRQQNS